MGRTAGEAETARPVVTSQNANVFRQQVTDIVVDAVALPERNKEKDKNESRYRQSRRDSAVQR